MQHLAVTHTAKHSAWSQSDAGDAGSAGNVSGKTGSEIASLIETIYSSTMRSYLTPMPYIGPYGIVFVL